MVEMLQNVEQCDHRESARVKRRFVQIAIHSGHAVARPSQRASSHRGIKPESRNASLTKQAGKQAAAAARIEHGAGRSDVAIRAFNERDVVTKHQRAVSFRKARELIATRIEPVVVRIESTQLRLGWRTRQARHAALPTADDLEFPLRRVVESIRLLKHRIDVRRIAPDTEIGIHLLDRRPRDELIQRYLISEDQSARFGGSQFASPKDLRALA